MQIIESKPLFKAEKYTDIKDIFKKTAIKYKDSPAYIYREYADGEILQKSFVESAKDREALGTALIDMGFAGKRIGIIGENSYRWAVSHLSVMSGVGVSVPLDRLLTQDEILRLLERGEVSAVFFDASFLETMKIAQEQISHIESFICMRGTRFTTAVPEDFCDRQGFFRFEDVIEKGFKLMKEGDRRYLDMEIYPDDMAALLFTSGTTAQSKGVMLSHENLVSDVYGMAQVEKFPEGGRYLSILPMHHTFESTCGLLYSHSIGICCCLSDGLRYIQKNLQEYKISMLVGVPILFENFYKKIQDGLKQKGKEKIVMRMIKLTGALRKVGIDIRKKVFKDILDYFGGELKYGICGAAPIDPEIIRFFEGIGLEIYQGYGLTETSPVIIACNPKNLVPGTVGLPIGGVTMAIDSENPFEEGEILVKGPMVMMGYYKDEEQTREVIGTDGWFHTGDVGCIDKKTGCLSITGRIKSMIVLKSGKKVFPEELEQEILRFPYVKEALVFGDCDDEGDVIVSAKVIFDKETLERDDVSESELTRMLSEVIKATNKILPSYKAIKQFVYGFHPFVKTTTLKIKRNEEVQKIISILKAENTTLKSKSGKELN